MAKGTQHIIQLPGGPLTVAAPVGTATVCVFQWETGVETIAVGTYDDFPVEYNGTAYKVWAHLTNPKSGGGATSGHVLLNGVSIADWSIPANEKDGVTLFTSVVNADDYDYFNIQITQVGATCTGPGTGLWIGVFIH